MSGAIAQWRKRAIDLKMAAVMTLGGIVGTIAGVWLFGVLRRAGQMDVVVSISYVILLGNRRRIDAARKSCDLACCAWRRRDVSDAPLRPASLDPRLAIQAALPRLQALHQRDTAARDRVCGRRALGDPWRRRRFHRRAGDDYVLRMPTNVGDRHVARPDHRHHGGDTVLQSVNNHAVDAFSGACPDYWRRHRRAIWRAHRRAAAWRTAAPDARADSHPRWHCVSSSGWSRGPHELYAIASGST